MLNNIVLMGRLTYGPELKHTQNGLAVTSFTLAVNRSYAKSGTERQTDFIDIVAWRSTAEFACKYLSKGQLIAVKGMLQTRTYQDKDGNNRKVVEVVVDNIYFAESKRECVGNGNSYTNNRTLDDNQSLISYSNGDTGDFEEISTDDDLPF